MRSPLSLLYHFVLINRCDGGGNFDLTKSGIRAIICLGIVQIEDVTVDLSRCDRRICIILAVSDPKETRFIASSF
ncbi:hypothetical protein [Merismopedia glauca]|uniref:hypothetical protein n=1 Tax=Merismopedia glauca TaxID=292586 RepID=UPI0030D7C123